MVSKRQFDSCLDSLVCVGRAERLGRAGRAALELNRLHDASTALTAILNGRGECDSTASMTRILCLIIEVRFILCVFYKPSVT